MSKSSREQERERLQRGLVLLGWEPASDLLDKLLEHVELIRKWTRSYNLVAKGDLDALIERHVLDSLAVHAWLSGDRILDVGSGAGFPGLPLAVLKPSCQFTLLDSSGKRARFLRAVVRQMNLPNVGVVEGRVEDYSPDAHYSTIVCRAFSALEHFVRSVRHLLTAETTLVAIKGRLPVDELAELPAWVEVQAVRPYEVPGLHAERHVVIMSLSRRPA